MNNLSTQNQIFYEKVYFFCSRVLRGGTVYRM